MDRRMRPRRMAVAGLSALLLALLVGCAGDAPVADADTAPGRDDARPSAVASSTPATTSAPTPGPGSDLAGWTSGAAFDYQLGGAAPPPDGVEVVVRDSSEPPARVGYDICYVNGFQTQPGVEWPEELLLHDASGELLTDPDWPEEHLFDTSDPTVRAEVAARLAPVVQGCAEAGYDGIELDNLDSWTRSQGALDVEDAVAHATLLVHRAHAAGLAVGQKNTAELGDRGRDEVGFDFAVVEECARYRECAAYADVYGDRVLAVEYTDALDAPFEQLCRSGDLPASTILRDRDLVVPEDEGYTYQRC